METLSLMLHISDESEISSGIAQAGATGVGSGDPTWVPGRVFFGVIGIFGLVGPSSSTTTSTSWYSVSGTTFLGIFNSGVGSKSGVGLVLGLGFGVSERTSLTDSSSGLGGDLEMQRNCSELCFWDWVAPFSWLLTQQPIVRGFFLFSFPSWKENGGNLVKGTGVKSD